MNRTTLQVFQPRSIALGLLMMVSPILADSALSQHACRIEELADDLEDMIDDRFDRSPMYRPLLRLAENLEHATDELEDRIDDQDFGCARGLIAESQMLGCQLSDLIASLPPCDVSPLHRERALQLIARMQGDLACLEGMITGSRVSFSGRAPKQGLRFQVGFRGTPTPGLANPWHGHGQADPRLNDPRFLSRPTFFRNDRFGGH